jgi:pre-mRNA-processing factor 6
MTLQNTDDAKVILANAARQLTQSVKIWLAAADLETDLKSKRKVLRTGKPCDVFA